MVAQKRGRGAKAQAAKAKVATPAAEEQVPDSEVVEAIEENNGQEQNEHAEEGAGDGAGVGGEGPEGEQAENADGDAKADDKKEDKVESGKLLVENLPSTYLFDYQEKLKDLFSKHGEVLNVK